jgi:sec-independent protein translocase protein TatC
MADEKVMSFTGHLAELRQRLLYSIYAVLAGVLVAYFFADIIFVLLAQPLIRAWTEAGLGPPRLHFANPIEPFFTYLKVALISGLFIASPVVFYQLWKFVAPGLYRNEKRYAVPFAIFSAAFFIGGACFGYFMVFPYGFRFFLGFAQENMGQMKTLFGHQVQFGVDNPFELSPMLMMGEYFGLVWRLLLAFGLVFELPLVITFLAMAGLVNPRALWRFNRYFVVLAAFVSAMLTPPDVITQLMMAGPLVVLYNISILLSWIFHRRRLKRQAQLADEAAAERPSGTEV